MVADARSIRYIFGVPIHGLTMDEVLGVADKAIADRRRLLIGVVNAAKLVNMNRDETLRRAVLSADLILADGMSVVWAARLLRRRLPARIAGIDLMVRLLELGDRRAYRVFCLGATDQVLDAVCEHMAVHYPRVRLAGRHHGYFTDGEERDVADRIASARPDILFVAMTSPKKEAFLARWSEHMGVPVCHGVGGAFDVIAGKVRRAPLVWQRLGMEWLYRVLQEPRRMWRRYLVTNTLFGWMLFSELVGGGVSCRKARV